jgi:hypothetical protein
MASFRVSLDQHIETEHRLQRVGLQHLLWRTAQLHMPVSHQQQAIAVARR